MWQYIWLKKDDLAQESSKTRRTREKLLKRFDEVDKKVTKQALDRKSNEISRWIKTNKNERVALVSKENGPVKASKSVSKLSTLLKKDD